MLGLVEMAEGETFSGGDHSLSSHGNYQSLYRKYRPQRFSEIKGQDHVVKALRNSVQEGRITHAYLFSGPRGTGKTSTARILAKALNCAEPKAGEPCGKCESCVSVKEQSSFDVHELDAASSGRVEDIRELVARASLATPGRYKVYIIDEVHMLSTAASNALLKTLEEPPDHVVFVLATTDPQKVLSTIRSRTQHYEFHLLPDATLDSLLTEVAAKEGIDIADSALEQVRKSGKGSARDALSVLDRVAAGGSAEDDFAECISEVISAMALYNPSSVLAALRKAFEIGIDPKSASSLIVDELRELLLANFQISSGGGNKTGRSVLLSEMAKSFSNARLVNAIEELGAAQVKMRDALEPRIILEITLIRLSATQTDSSPEALLQRISALESEVVRMKSLFGEMNSNKEERNSLFSRKSEKESPVEQKTLGAVKPALGAYLKNSKGPEASPKTTAPSFLAGGPSATGQNTKRDMAPPQSAGNTAGQNSGAPPPRSSAADSVADVKSDSSEGTPLLPNRQIDGPALRDQLVEIWGDKVLKHLRLKARAIYVGGHFVLDRDNLPLFVFMNEATLNHAKPLRAEVEQIISEELGYKFVLNIGVERQEDVSGRHGGAPVSNRAGAENKKSESGTDAVAPGAGNKEDREIYSSTAKESKQPPSESTSVPGRSAKRKPAADFVHSKAPADGGRRNSGVSVDLPADETYDDFELMPAEDAVTPVTLAVEHVLKVFPGAEEVSDNV